MLQEERIFSETLRNQEIAFGDSLLSAGGILFLATLLFARPRIWFGFCFIIRAEGLSHMQQSVRQVVVESFEGRKRREKVSDEDSRKAERERGEFRLAASSSLLNLMDEEEEEGFWLVG